MTAHPTATLDDQPTSVEPRSLPRGRACLLYAYVDILGFAPGRVDDILNGGVFTFDITQTWAVSVLEHPAVPIVMIVATATLPPRVSRVVNLVVARSVPFTAFNAVGDIWRTYQILAVAWS